MKVTALFVSLVIFSLPVSDADELFGSFFSRGVHGEISDYSAEQLDRMIRRAESDGRINVWVTFDVSFNQNPTAEQIRQTWGEVEIAFAHAVLPLIKRGDATELDLPETLIGAPGRMVSVNAPGLLSLASQDSVKYIGYILLDK